eukprot:jgi/Bigna1/89320/estExt_fgenesh1_pg.C_470041
MANGMKMFSSAETLLARAEANVVLCQNILNEVEGALKDSSCESKAQRDRAGVKPDTADTAVTAVEKTKSALERLLASPLSRLNAWLGELMSLGQTHVAVKMLQSKSDIDAQSNRFVAQLESLDKQYPGGLRSYVSNAHRLLLDSRSGANAFAGLKPSPPPLGVHLEPGTKEFDRAEIQGLEEAKNAAYVLVAGGLGERLGYNGIKVAMPTEMVTQRCYLQLYIERIRALSNGHAAPIAIMTSDDTHAKTVALLEANRHFGVEASRVVLLKQEKVPSLATDEAHFDVKGGGSDSGEDAVVRLLTKPHGHGDVHVLLHKHGLVKKWKARGIRWVCFFQDTNSLVFNAMTVSLGVSRAKNLSMSSITVGRKPGEPKGAICLLDRVEQKGEDTRPRRSPASEESTSNTHAITVNVEYNQLDSLLRANGHPQGDVLPAADASSVASKGVSGVFSPFPGNINAFNVELENYLEVLERTGGRVPEFVNPKYKDTAKTAFKKPTRLECMMQDLPRLFGREASQRVGYCMLPRWFACSSVKNNVVDAKAKLKKTGYAECAATGEADLYRLNRMLLHKIGVDIKVDAGLKEYLGIPVSSGARIVFSAAFAASFQAFKKRFPYPKQVRISDRSTLILDGRNIVVNALELDGSLSIISTPKDQKQPSSGAAEKAKTKERKTSNILVGEKLSKSRFKPLVVKNKGHEVLPILPSSNEPKEVKIRGYSLKNNEQHEQWRTPNKAKPKKSQGFVSHPPATSAWPVGRHKSSGVSGRTWGEGIVSVVFSGMFGIYDIDDTKKLRASALVEKTLTAPEQSAYFCVTEITGGSWRKFLNTNQSYGTCNNGL